MRRVSCILGAVSAQAALCLCAIAAAAAASPVVTPLAYGECTEPPAPTEAQACRSFPTLRERRVASDAQLREWPRQQSARRWARALASGGPSLGGGSQAAFEVQSPCAAPPKPWPAAYERQWLALQAVYNALGGDGWSPKTRGGWLLEGVSLCCWQGITCTPAPGAAAAVDSAAGAPVVPNVTRLVLAFDTGVSGVLPPQLFSLTELTELAIVHCDVRGQLPEDIGRLTRLGALALAGNAMSGTIPQALFTLPMLAWCGLNSNRFSGSISEQWGRVASLGNLDLGDNAFTGTIPDALFGLTRLTYLHLNNNGLTGSISPKIGALVSLGNLAFAYNELSSTLPDELYGLTELTQIDMSSNLLTGTLSPKVGALKGLLALDIDTNDLSGTLPSALYDLTGLVELFLDSNQFSGSISSKIGAFAGLQELALDTNAFDGRIPNELWSLASLTYLSLHSNRLAGTIGAGVGAMTGLQLLDASDNAITGTLPDTLWNAQALTGLYVGGNRLSGSLSERVGNLTGLNQLVLSGNGFSGAIPGSVYDLVSLKELSLDGNAFRGTLSARIGRLSQLQTMALNSNGAGLGGPLPEALYENCTQLQTVDISGNAFSGTLSRSIGRLRALTWLVADHNQLVGSIPSELAECSRLEVLILSNNRFTGAVPAALGGLQHAKGLGLGGNLLSSSLPAELSGMRELRVLSVAHNDLSGTIPAPLGDLPSLETLVLASNSFEGSLPSTLSQPVNLTHLDVSHNPRVWGTVPAELGASQAKLRFLSVRASSLSGRLPPQIASLPALRSACLDLNLFSCGVPAAWDAPAAFAGIAAPSSAARAAGVAVGGCPTPEDGTLLAVTGTALACPLGAAITAKDVGADSFQCVGSLVTTYAAWLLVCAACAGVALCVACSVQPRFGAAATPCAVADLDQSPGAAAAHLLVEQTRRVAVAATALVPLAGAATALALGAASPLLCRGGWAPSLLGVRYDVPGWERGRLVAAGEEDSAAVDALWLVLPAAVGAAATTAWCAACRRLPASAQRHRGALVSGPDWTPARESASLNGAEATAAVGTSRGAAGAKLSRRWCARTALVTVAALTGGVVLSAGPNAAFVAVQSSTTITPGVKAAAHHAMSAVKALQNAVLLPRVASAAGHDRSLFWLALALRVANKVVIPVITVLLLDQRCFAGSMPWHTPVPGTVDLVVPYCRVHGTNSSGAVIECWRMGTKTFTENTAFTSRFSPACGSAVVERYGSVVTLAVVLQATVLVAARLLRHACVSRLRQRVHAAGRIAGGAAPDTNLRWLAHSPGRLAATCRWVATRASSAWCDAADMPSLWAGVITSVTVMLAWGTVYPLASVAACAWLWATWAGQRRMLRADAAQLAEFTAGGGVNGTGRSSTGGADGSLVARGGSAPLSLSALRGSAGGDGGLLHAEGTTAAGPAGGDSAARALAASMSEVRRVGQLRLKARWGHEGAGPAADTDNGLATSSRPREDTGLSSTSTQLGWDAATLELARRDWVQEWRVWVVPVLVACGFHAAFFGGTGAFAGTRAAVAGVWLPAAAAIGAACIAWAISRCHRGRRLRAGSGEGVSGAGYVVLPDDRE